MQEVKAVCLNSERGPKNQVNYLELIENFGVAGDYHAKINSNRQVSVLIKEQIDSLIIDGFNIKDGAFGENIIVSGLDFKSVSVGDIFNIGNSVVLQVTLIGKECHTPCIIYKTVGRCVMPETGIFCKVVKGGIVKNGDRFNYCK